MLADEKWIRYVQGRIWFEIDVAQGSDGADAMREHYSVDSLPTLVVLDGTGKQLGQVVGADATPDEYIAAVDEAQNGR